MTNLIAENARKLQTIARRRHVRRLAVFGSALKEGFDAARSEIDVLVELDEMLRPVEREDAYFALLADLEALFRRKADLVERAAFPNPIVRESVEATKVVVYDAAWCRGVPPWTSTRRARC